MHKFVTIQAMSCDVGRHISYDDILVNIPSYTDCKSVNHHSPLVDQNLKFLCFGVGNKWTVSTTTAGGIFWQYIARKLFLQKQDPRIPPNCADKQSCLSALSIQVMEIIPEPAD